MKFLTLNSHSWMEENAQQKFETLKEQILETQQEEVGLEEQVAKRQQMWDSLIECSEGYTEFDDEFIRQIIQKITVEDADTIRIQFRDSDVVLEQGLQ